MGTVRELPRRAEEVARRLGRPRPVLVPVLAVPTRVDAVGRAVAPIGPLDPPRGAAPRPIVVAAAKEQGVVGQAVVVDLYVETVGPKGVRHQRPPPGVHRHGARADTGGEVVVRL